VPAALLAAAAPAAQATDLLVLDGETATLSGANDYGIVYIDGELRLTGDTSINASSVYIGPNASLRTCYTASPAGDNCQIGRSLAIHSATTLTIEPNLDLTGRTGTPRPGGGLVLSGIDVAVGGSITTAGSNGGASGAVNIDAARLATTGAITAYGAPVQINAARSISVNGDIHTEGVAQLPLPAGRAQAGGSVGITSPGGDVAVRGSITTFGRDAPTAQGGGGVGGDVTLTGGDVRVGAVDSTGGSSTDIDGGPAGAIRLTARGTLQALGKLDASGSGSTNGFALDGGLISASAAGPAILAGGVAVGGANAPAGGSNGGRFEVEGGSVTVGPVTDAGGNATSSATPQNGGAGGAVVVRSHGATSLGSIAAGGGTGQVRGGPGGSVSVSGASISVGQVSTNAANAAAAPGADGGPVALDSDGALSLGGALTTSGGAATANAAAVFPGGAGGHVLLRAGEGTLDLGGPVWSTGGRGSSSATNGVKGGAGGAGGGIDIVARSLGTVVSIVSDGGDGGDYGTDQGPGGAGGAIHGFTDGPLLDDLKVVAADGGAGNGPGPSGTRTLESSPQKLAISPTGVLSFVSRSPGAERYRVLKLVPGAAPEVVTETTATSVPVTVPRCTPVQLTVVAVHTGVRWVSDAPAPVTYVAQPSATQTCATPAALRSSEKAVVRKLSSVRKAKWKLTLPLAAAGVGHIDATLQKGKRKIVTLGTAKADVAAPGPVKLAFTLPKGQRGAGRLTLVLVVTSPDGTKKTTTKIAVTVKNDHPKASAIKSKHKATKKGHK